MIIKELNNEAKKLENLEFQARRCLDIMPKKQLYCFERKSGFQYYDGKKYLGKKEAEHAKNMAMRDCYEKMYPAIKEALKGIKALLEFFENKTLDNIYEKMNEGKKILIGNDVDTPESRIRRFKEEKYDPGNFNEDDKSEYYTEKGERVRSKAEVIIANALYMRGIPYHYEQPMYLQAGSRKVLFRPDFQTVNISTGRRWILEHFGMMDSENYYKGAVQKIRVYENNGIMLGRNLILLYETSENPLSMRSVKKYIEEYLI